MDINLGRPTAKIYQFPVRAMRRPGDETRTELRPTTTFDTPPEPVVYESGWYHGEAIAEERRNVKQ